MATIGRVNKIPLQGCTVEWQIPEKFFSTEEYNGEDDEPTRYSSPLFSFAGGTWVLKLLPNGNCLYDPCAILFLKRSSSGPPITIEFTLGIKHLGQKGDAVGHYTYTFLDANEACGFYRYLMKSDLTERPCSLMPDGVLTVFCTLKCSELFDDSDVETLRRDYKKVLLNGSNHDLILKVGDKELKAHQDILKARSQVFQSMLSHKMIEKSSGVIDVSDCDSQTMEQFLLYVYCGKVETLDESNMFKLYYIADKYDIEDLKEKCSEFIKKSLSPTNICEIIQLALNHCDSSLLENATDYFGSNVLDILHTEEWQSFLRDNHTVANDLLIRHFEQKKT